jgi:hypothetical protein
MVAALQAVRHPLCRGLPAHPLSGRHISGAVLHPGLRQRCFALHHRGGRHLHLCHRLYRRDHPRRAGIRGPPAGRSGNGDEFQPMADAFPGDPAPVLGGDPAPGRGFHGGVHQGYGAGLPGWRLRTHLSGQGTEQRGLFRHPGLRQHRPALFRHVLSPEPLRHVAGEATCIISKSKI